MIEARKFRLRVSYVKQGRLAHLSHLEITSALEREIRRAKLPFAVSQGFSPHMKISFGSALPVGVGSICEIFDIYLKEYIKADDALAALQEVSVSDLMPFDVKYVDNKAPAASVAYKFSTYLVKCDEEVPDFDVPEVIEVVKKKKAKELLVDDYLCEMPLVDGNEIEFSLESKQTGSLRPDLLIQHFNLPCRVESITRISQN